MQIAIPIPQQAGTKQTMQIARSLEQDEARELSGSQILCEALVHEGVELLYGYPGGAIMPFYDALTSYPSLHHVLVRHEQAAAHAADGYARATGRVGVCIATSGPGATNLVTGLATAFMDSTPVVAITGQVVWSLIGRDGFQEIDILGITQPITKHNFLVERVEDLANIVHEAFCLARSGRPGPVLIDVPKDIQFARTLYRPAASAPDALTYLLSTRKPCVQIETIARAAELIARSRRPLLLAGHGVILSKAYAELLAFAEKSDMPVITTLLGLSAIPETHPLAMGMPGMHGPAHVNNAINEADLLIAVGMRFDDRVTGKVDCFAPQAQIIHIDIDPSEMHKVKRAEVPIVADARDALAALIEAIKPARHESWLQEIRSWALAANEVCQVWYNEELPDPTSILKAIHDATRGEAIIVSDVGQHQMWTARFYPWTRPNSHITSGGLGTMGFALPAAMGVKMGMPQETVWVIAGDGGIQMNIQELATLKQQGVILKVAIMNNGYLGMVRQWQEFFHDHNYSETPIAGPDYTKLAEAYGLQGMRITRRQDVAQAVREAMEIESTVIIDFVIEAESNVYPMVVPGSAITNMIQQTKDETRNTGQHSQM